MSPVIRCGGIGWRGAGLEMMAAVSDKPVKMPGLLRIHWLWALVLGVVTLGIFTGVLFIVQAWWASKVRGTRLALVLVVSKVGLTFALLILNHVMNVSEVDFAGGYASLLSRVLWIAAVYVVRGELAAEPIGMCLGWIMPMLFGPLYFQYHLRDYGYEGVSGRPLGLSA